MDKLSSIPRSQPAGSDFDARLRSINTVTHVGRVVQAFGTSIRVTGIRARIGQRCLITDHHNRQSLLADVVGLADGQAILFPLGNLLGVAVDSEVRVLDELTTVPVGDSMRGGVFDGLGQPVGDTPEPTNVTQYPLEAPAPDPLTRTPINETFVTGVRAIDSMLTVGVGQRLGIFAMAGGGKSTLLSMLAKAARADIIVIAMIGERGREVREFIEHNLGPEGLARSILVVATSDRPAMERVKAAQSATAIAEGFRAQGKRVLLLMDSVTRYARALREIGLSIGEPPVRRGFPPSVFAELPKLFERVGNDENGSITAFYTVLAEDEDGSDPVAEETRSILDGHIVLSRKLGEQGHYPAIDVLASTSRVFNQLASAEHQAAAIRLRSLLAKHRDVEFLVQVGEYQQGSDTLADEAIAKRDATNDFLRQDTEDDSEQELTMEKLFNLVTPTAPSPAPVPEPESESKQQ